MSHVQSLMLATQLCGHNGRGDLAAYTLTCFESYEHIQDRIVESFLPKLTAFPGGLAGNQGSRTAELCVEISEDVSQILT